MEQLLVGESGNYLSPRHMSETARAYSVAWGGIELHFYSVVRTAGFAPATPTFPGQPFCKLNI